MMPHMYIIPGPVIADPANARHFIWADEFARRVTVGIGDTILAETDHPLRVTEVADTVFAPLLYLPIKDATPLLKINSKTTHCPLKGDASYFDLLSTGGEIIERNIAWSYIDPLEFALLLRGRISFNVARVHISEHPI